MRTFRYFAMFMLFLCSLSLFALDISKFEGHWIGKGKVIVSWCKKKTLLFDLKIEKNGKITGRIGDAKVVKGKIYSNFLGVLNGDYVIEVELSGFLVKKEKIKRKKMKIMVDLKGDYLVGGFRSSGLKIGDKSSMALTGTDLVLKRNKK